MFKGSKIYVAGHTGLLGSALLRRLSSEGFTSVVTRTHGELDLTAQAAVFDFFKKEKPEYVFLAAGLTGGITANRSKPAAFFHTNIGIQDNVFEAARRYDAKHLVFYGSSCVYPKCASQPMSEASMLTGAIEETSEAYAIAKMAGLKACRAYNIEDKANRFIALLPNSMYGPHDNFSLENSHVLSALMRKFSDAKRNNEAHVELWGSGVPLREFVFSEDVADASLFAVKNAQRLENSHYNIGSGAECSIRQLAGLIAKCVGYEGEAVWDASKPNGALRKLLDSSRFMALGWLPSVGLEDGIKKTYEWYLENMTAGKEVL